MSDRNEYRAAQTRLAQGWNTWHTRSVMCWVRLPEAFAINLGVKNYTNGTHLREILIGREKVAVGGHAYDGSYSKLRLEHGLTTLELETGCEGADWVARITPACRAVRTSLLTIEPGVLWNRPGQVWRADDHLAARCGATDFQVHWIGETVDDPNIVALTPYAALRLDRPVAISTGRPRTLAEIEAVIAACRARHAARQAAYGAHAELYDAIQSCTAWDTIYEPIRQRVITPVSRVWNSGGRGGYVLFCWDTFFAGVLAGVDHPDLAYANVVEILREKTDAGFVPNNRQATGRVSGDRSQPPVGSLSILQLYDKYGDRWLLEQTADDLLAWNRWWKKRECEGYLCWGSHPFTVAVGDPKELEQQNTLQGARYESGLDNSPMYDDVPFDPVKHLMPVADVGLMSLYIADCRALARIMTLLGRPEAAELDARGDAVAARLRTLWDDHAGLFLNKRLDTGAFERRLSPTHFYPLLAEVPTPAQADRMIREHLLNPDEFWGDWILPSIARDDPAYGDNVYWRGRIWAPMNWLVYLGLRKYAAPALVADFAAKSADLLLKEWRRARHIHENYNAATGEGCDSVRSDAFYHWGALLALIKLCDDGVWSRR